MLVFALGHEQLPAAYGFAARPALQTLEADLSPEELAAARDTAAKTSLAELVEQALAPVGEEMPAANL